MNKKNQLILSNIVSSQVDIHKEFGGVVPELAARSHIEKIDLITKKAIDESGIKMNYYRCCCIYSRTRSYSLFICWFKFWKTIASFLNKPFIAVNHLEGHALSPKLNSDLN